MKSSEMCKSPQHIKLCTCIDDSINIESLDNYWILYRYNIVKEIFVLGEVKLPTFPDNNEIINNEEGRINELILERLNEGSIFDKDIEYQDCDRLHIIIKLPDESDKSTYEYEFIEDEWCTADKDPTDPFYVENNYDEVSKGRVE